MSEVLKQGLLITALGMGLVFVMIIALWGIMALLVRATQAGNPEPEKDAEETPALEEAFVAATDRHKQAAAAAVALAMAQAQAELSVLHADNSCAPSSWLIAGRSQQIQQTIQRGRKR